MTVLSQGVGRKWDLSTKAFALSVLQWSLLASASWAMRNGLFSPETIFMLPLTAGLAATTLGLEEL